MTTMLMKVCPHDTIHEPERWLELERYLEAHTGIEVQFDISIDFADFHEGLAQAAIIYANPTDTLKLVDQHGFRALVRPAGRYDEAVLVCNADAEATLSAINGKPLSTVVEQLSTRIALRMLASQGITPSELHNVDAWQAVVSRLWHGDGQYGVIYKDTYDNFSQQSKDLVVFLAATDEQVAFHTIVVGPALAAHADAIQAVLLGMHDDPQGKSLLESLHIPQFVAVSAAELAQLRVVASA